jgi:hypothetical protein
MKYLTALFILSIFSLAYGSEYSCMGLRNSESLKRSYNGPTIIVEQNETSIGKMAEFEVSLKETEDDVFIILKNGNYYKQASAKKGYVSYYEFTNEGNISVSCTSLENFSAL